jgi:hypothetical protein
MPRPHAVPTAGPPGSPVFDAGGWALLLALLKAALLGIAVLFVRMREAAAI